MQGTCLASRPRCNQASGSGRRGRFGCPSIRNRPRPRQRLQALCFQDARSQACCREGEANSRVEVQRQRGPSTDGYYSSSQQNQNRSPTSPSKAEFANFACKRRRERSPSTRGHVYAYVELCCYSAQPRTVPTTSANGQFEQ